MVPIRRRPASIRPRPFSRGNGFFLTGINSESHLLQFGHELSSVETNPTDNFRRRSCAASIRPRPFSRGNKRLCKGVTFLQAVLQFGHDLSAVETSQGDPLNCGYRITLQFGHELSAVETILPDVIAGGFPCASIRPRPFSRGN